MLLPSHLSEDIIDLSNELASLTYAFDEIATRRLSALLRRVLIDKRGSVDAQLRAASHDPRLHLVYDARDATHELWANLTIGGRTAASVGQFVRSRFVVPHDVEPGPTVEQVIGIVANCMGGVHSQRLNSEQTEQLQWLRGNLGDRGEALALSAVAQVVHRAMLKVARRVVGVDSLYDQRTGPEGAHLRARVQHAAPSVSHDTEVISLWTAGNDEAWLSLRLRDQRLRMFVVGVDGAIAVLGPHISNRWHTVEVSVFNHHQWSVIDLRVDAVRVIQVAGNIPVFHVEQVRIGGGTHSAFRVSQFACGRSVLTTRQELHLDALSAGLDTKNAPVIIIPRNGALSGRLGPTGGLMLRAEDGGPVFVEQSDGTLRRLEAWAASWGGLAKGR